MTTQREEKIYAVLLTLAGGTEARRDIGAVVDTLLHSGRALLGAAGVAVALTDASGDLRIAGATGRSARDLALVGLRHGGPVRQAHEERTPVAFIDGQDGRLPRFTAEARQRGVHTFYAVPVAAGGDALGSLALYWCDRVAVPDDYSRLIAVLGRMAAVGIANRRAIDKCELRAQQLQQALESRVVIEQAKGMLAERAKTDPATAFDLMRATARAGGRRLVEVAEEVVHNLSYVPQTGQGQQVPDSPGFQQGRTDHHRARSVERPGRARRRGGR